MAEDETVEGTPDPVPAETTEQDPIETLPLAPDNRPEKNVLAEMSRKYTKIERQNQEIMAALQSMQQRWAAPPAPAPMSSPPAVAGSEYTDEQLGQLAGVLNPEAFRLLVERQTARQTQAQFSQFTQAQTVQRALGELIARYPMLRDDTSHPLTQAVYAARNQFLASGWTPGPQTDLEAIKAAIVNAPHLVPAPNAPGQDVTRRAGVTAQQSMEGAASRRSPQSGQTQQVRPLSKDVAGIARRMGVKDPQGSLKRFQDRQQAGRSTVSPAVQQAVRENEQA